MKYELAEITKKQDYLPLELFDNTQFTQAWFYGQWQEFTGRNIRRFAFKKADQTIAYFQVIPHDLPLGKKYLYIPFGPVFAEEPDAKTLNALANALIQAYASENVIFARTDPDGPFGAVGTIEARAWHRAPRFIGKEASFRPRGEMAVELTDEDKVFASFDKNTRYSARYGQKHGVTTRVNTDLASGFDDFYRLLKYTSELQNFAIFSESYYQNLLNVCAEQKNAYFVEAIKDNHVISSKLIVTYGHVAHSLLSGTDDEGRKLRVPSLVQWEAMREAMKRECSRYSIGGASSSDSDYPSIKKVTKYKQGFGGHVIVHSDLHDIVFDKPTYYGYLAYKRLRTLL